MSEIIDFYKNLPSHPYGYTHQEIIFHWSDDKWDSCHNFIQWMFPLKEPSSFSEDAPILTDEDIKLFKSDSPLVMMPPFESLKHKVLSSHLRFLRFLGLRYHFNGNKWVTIPIQSNIDGDELAKITPNYWQVELYSDDEIKKKKQIWKGGPNHNWLRITRVLTSLRLLGLKETSASFFDALCLLYNEEPDISPNTFQFWCQTQCD